MRINKYKLTVTDKKTGNCQIESELVQFSYTLSIMLFFPYRKDQRVFK